MMSSAILSDCGVYRYHLRREWNGDTPPGDETREQFEEMSLFSRPAKREHVLWVMLNPSTADAKTNDPTIRKCIGFSSRWGYRALEVVNLFAFRATDPRELARAWAAGVEVVGPDTNQHIRFAAQEADRVVVAWGGFSGCGITARAREVCGLLGEAPALCLGVTKDGQPRHPLMLPYATSTEPWVRS